MAAPTNSVSSVLRVLNLNKADSDSYTDLINDYFGNREDYSSGESDSQDDSDTEDEMDSFVTVTADPVENIIPREPRLQAAQHSLTNGDKKSAASVCQCCLNNGNPCYTVFSPEEIESFRSQYLSLTRDELDICILSKLSCILHVDGLTRRSKHRDQTERKASRADYIHHGHHVCRDFFMFIHDIGKSKLTSLIKHYTNNGVESRMHKNSNKLPTHALRYEDIRRIIDFISNYAEIHAIQLPGRTPNHWNSDVKLLPTSCTKRTVHEEFLNACSEVDRKVKISVFRQLWDRLVPHIRTMPPASDLCWICQKGTMKLARCVNKSDTEKSEALQELESHQQIVSEERRFYQNICREVKEQLPLNLQQGRHEPCSFNGKNHVSFDFAQQIHYPYNPLQPGPIFFKTPRKCGLFGLNCEAVRKQLNITIDEAHACGKGANTVVSLLHYYLDNYSFGETDLYLHADNCAGQNKNSTMLWYLSWQCRNGLNKSITLSFLITGHTKFSPDGGFGLIKRKFKKTKVDCLQDFQNVILTSSEMNTAEFVGEENEPSRIHTYDWNLHLSPYYVKLNGIKKFHHFRFTSDGTVVCKHSINAQPESHTLIKKCATVPSSLPRIIQPDGLNLKRQWYLYNEIRPFVADEFKDRVCPKPSVVLNHQQSSGEEEIITEHPKKKTKKKCIK